MGLSHIYTEAHDLSVEILTGDAWPYFRDESLERVAKEKPIKGIPSHSGAMEAALDGESDSGDERVMNESGDA